MHTCARRGVPVLLAAGAWLAAGTAMAQPEAPEQHAEEAPDPTEAPEESETTWKASLGAVLNLGNTRSWSVNGGTDFRLVRGRHAFGAGGQISYGQVDLRDDDPDQGFVDTARNINLKARYDLFFTQMDAVFTALVYRWDTFAGLDARVQGQLGYLRNFFKAEKHRAWGEIGYDITYDNFHPDPLPDPDDPTMFLDGTQIVHAARGFVGYENQLNEAVAVTTGLEVLVNMQQAEDTRINWNGTLNSKLVDRLSLDLKLSVKFDNVPVPGRQKTDFLTQLNLTYQML